MFKKKKRIRRQMSRTEADILACKRMLNDMQNGNEQPLLFYDHVSDQLCGKPSRNIY